MNNEELQKIIEEVKKQIYIETREEIKKMMEEKLKQITRFHYGKKEQVELASMWNQANRLVQLEIEIGKDKRYFNDDGTLNKFYLEERLNSVMDFLMRHFIAKEQSYRPDYFAIRDEIKNK